MDIRNIKEEPVEIKDQSYLEHIYDLQSFLLDGYIGRIEKDLPYPPIDINSRSGQLVLKDFTARVIEEMGEGYESTGYALDILNKVGFNIDILSNEDHRMLLNHLQNSNEEQADAMAFFVSLLMYSNIWPEDIYRFVEVKELSYKYSETWSRNMMNLMKVGLNLLLDRFPDITSGNPYPILQEGDYDPERWSNIQGYIPGYNFLSNSLHDFEAQLCWEVTYHLCVARNFLKNKPWKQTEVMTDELRFQEEIVLAFLKYLGYLLYVGFKPDTFHRLFFKKHKVNIFRQRSNY